MCLALLGISFWGCPDKDNNKEKFVDITIYSEKEYGVFWGCDCWVKVPFFSDSDDNQKRPLMNIITEGFDFDYEEGNEYTFKAKKVWMADPPMDVSSIRYEFIGPLTKTRTVVEASEEEIEVFVASELVKYLAGEIVDAMLVRETTSNKVSILEEIDGFDYESGFDYTLSVKKIIQAEPYLVRYILLETKDKQKK
jgi:hypothetical protein